MVLIISEEKDLITNDVIDWLIYYNYPFIRINPTTKVEIENFIISNREVAFTLLVSDPNKKKG